MPCWYYDKEALQKTPSIQDGITFEDEYNFRKEGARLILDIGTIMDLGYNTMATGVVYFHRFYMFHSFKTFHQYLTACCCLFLAGKAEETPKKCKDIIKTAKKLLSAEEFSAFGKNPKEEVMIIERVLLQTIKFDLKVQHPYTYLLRYAKCLKGEKHSRRRLQKMVQMAWTFINDSLCTTLAIQWEPEIIAISVLYLAEKLSKFKIISWAGRKSCHKKWWDVFVEDLQMNVVEDICHQILDLYSSRKLQNCQSDFPTNDNESMKENCENQPEVSENAVGKMQSAVCKEDPSKLQLCVSEKKICHVKPLASKNEVCPELTDNSANICPVSPAKFKNGICQLEQAVCKSENCQLHSSAEINGNCHLQIMGQVDKSCNLLTFACMDKNCNIKSVLCKNEVCRSQLIRWRDALCKEQKLIPIKYPANPYLQNGNPVTPKLEQTPLADSIPLRDPRRENSVLLANDQSQYSTQCMQETPISPSSPSNFNFLRPRSPAHCAALIPTRKIDPGILCGNFELLDNERDSGNFKYETRCESHESSRGFCRNNRGFGPSRYNDDFDAPENFRCSDPRVNRGFNSQRNYRRFDDMEKDFDRSKNGRGFGYQKNNKGFGGVDEDFCATEEKKRGFSCPRNNRGFNEREEDFVKTDDDRGFGCYRNSSSGFNTSDQRSFGSHNNNRGFDTQRNRGFGSRENDRKFSTSGDRGFGPQGNTRGFGSRERGFDNSRETGWDSKDKDFDAPGEARGWNSRGRGFGPRYNNRNFDIKSSRGFGHSEEDNNYNTQGRRGFGPKENNRGFGPIRNRGFGSYTNNRGFDSNRRNSFDSSSDRGFCSQRGSRGFGNFNGRRSFNNSCENSNSNNFVNNSDLHDSRTEFGEVGTKKGFCSIENNKKFKDSENWDDEEDLNYKVNERESPKKRCSKTEFGDVETRKGFCDIENDKKFQDPENWDDEEDLNNKLDERESPKERCIDEGLHNTNDKLSENWDADKSFNNYKHEREISKKLICSDKSFANNIDNFESEDNNRLNNSENCDDEESFNSVNKKEFSKKRSFDEAFNNNNGNSESQHSKDFENDGNGDEEKSLNNSIDEKPISKKRIIDEHFSSNNIKIESLKDISFENDEDWKVDENFNINKNEKQFSKKRSSDKSFSSSSIDKLESENNNKFENSEHWHTDESFSNVSEKGFSEKQNFHEASQNNNNSEFDPQNSQDFENVEIWDADASFNELINEKELSKKRKTCEKWDEESFNNNVGEDEYSKRSFDDDSKESIKKKKLE